MKWLFFFLVFLLTNCTTINQTKNDEVLKSIDCEKSYNFIKNEISENEEGWFEIKDKEIIYHEYDKGNFKFPFYKCFNGKDKMFLVELFGIPHREYINKRQRYHELVFCFSKKCNDINTKSGLANPAIIFFLDEKELVKEYYSNLNLVGDYKSLNRY